MKFRDRVAIVTGAASGFGRAIALSLAEGGARIAVADVNEEGARETVRMLVQEGGEGHAYRVDVTRTREIEAMVADVIRRWGSVHILVNNAGWDRVMPFAETSEELWDTLLAINLKGHIACTRAAMDPMIKQEYGKIVNISSDAGRVGSSGEAVYSAAKGGLIAFTKTMARELARYRINVNCVCPGPSETPFFKREVTDVNPRLAESLKRGIPLGRLGTPADVAAAVLFLASDDAAYITGQTLSVSGGLTMV